MERKMTVALRYQYKLIFSAWGTKRKAAAEDYKKFGLALSETFRRMYWKKQTRRDSLKEW